jgi:hypothetical protein
VNNLEIDISSNFIDMDKTISKEGYIDKVTMLLENILKRRFPNDIIKQQIKTHRDRINFSCPYCGDSMHSSYKKRGNIILEGKHTNFYKCFNCGEFHRVDKFFKDFNTDLELEVINYISDNQGNFSTSLSGKYDISLLLDVETIEGYAIDRLEIKNKFGLVEVKESPAWSWLTKRLQFTPERFLYSPSKKYILILNLTPSGKIIGSQKRLFYGDNKYLTFGASKLYELTGRGKVTDEIDLISQLFGIMQINFAHPITIFEGPFDSFLFKNSIANTGANKKFPLDIPVRYWFDDDKTGNEKSLKILEEGKTVFLWEKFRRDCNLPYRKKWDLNDVMLWAKKENVRLPMFDQYFSNDILDMIDL